GVADAIDVRLGLDRTGLLRKEIAEIESVRTGGDGGHGRVAVAGVFEERAGGDELRVGVEIEFANALAERRRAGHPSRAGLADEGVALPLGGKSAPAERALLHE